MKGELILIIYILLMQITNQVCTKEQQLIQGQKYILLKRNHKNALQQQAGALISTARNNFLQAGNLGSCLKDDPYSLSLD
ncbi:unnamed protein product [Paramecium octaurelia]|uniref:Uncharacterized protein n=1 Tax=Paramecium octaurelia TaxID=43137 RepID=A0A8S1XMG4_PAROT|nr:unnamed protein product [Paramecium octaurelia]CAD8201912.1 unnamed protein product [Paramecium octaurelia]